MPVSSEAEVKPRPKRPDDLKVPHPLRAADALLQGNTRILHHRVVAAHSDKQGVRTTKLVGPQIRAVS